MRYSCLEVPRNLLLFLALSLDLIPQDVYILFCVHQEKHSVLVNHANLRV